MGTGNKKPTNTVLTNNEFAFLVDEVQYELKTVEIDSVRNPGITTTLKGYMSLSEDDLKNMNNAGWISDPGRLGEAVETTTDGE